MCKTKRNKNIFRLTKSGEYKYKYEYLDWYLQIPIQIRICVTHWLQVDFTESEFSANISEWFWQPSIEMECSARCAARNRLDVMSTFFTYN